MFFNTAAVRFLTSLAALFFLLQFYRGTNFYTTYALNPDVEDAFSSRRDGSLNFLVGLLNKQKSIFQDWSLPSGSDENFGGLMKALSPWVLSDFPVPLLKNKLPASTAIDCANPAYNAALSGKQLNHKTGRVIVDFIPFGYDVDKLEIRLFETFPLVDIFVLYEAPRTQSGVTKPNFISILLEGRNSSSWSQVASRRAARFQKWKQKMIVISASDREIQSFLQTTKNALRRSDARTSWALEKSMRTEMVRHFVNVWETYAAPAVAISNAPVLSEALSSSQALTSSPDPDNELKSAGNTVHEQQTTAVSRPVTATATTTAMDSDGNSDKTKQVQALPRRERVGGRKGSKKEHHVPAEISSIDSSPSSASGDAISIRSRRTLRQWSKSPRPPRGEATGRQQKQDRPDRNSDSSNILANQTVPPSTVEPEQMSSISQQPHRSALPRNGTSVRAERADINREKRLQHSSLTSPSSLSPYATTNNNDVNRLSGLSTSSDNSAAATAATAATTVGGGRLAGTRYHRQPPAHPATAVASTSTLSASASSSTFTTLARRYSPSSSSSSVLTAPLGSQIIIGDLAAIALRKLHDPLIMSTAIGTQNDGDELILHHPLLHLKHCELSNPKEAAKKGIYLPAFSYKKNFHWLQSTVDLKECFSTDTTTTGTTGGTTSGGSGGGGGSTFNENTNVLKKHLWKPGPYVWPLQVLLDAKDTKRPPWQDKACPSSHMGLSAAIHLSSVADPVEYLMKRCGVIEQRPENVLSFSFLTAAKQGRVTAELIARETLQPWCNQMYPAVHDKDPSLSKEARKYLEQSIPWVVRQNPDSFPFLLPARVSPELAGYLRICGSPEWSELCQLKNATAY